MKPPGNGIVSSSLPKALDAATLLLVVLAAILLFLNMTVFQQHPEFGPALNRIMRVLALAVSILLLSTILLQSSRAKGEGAIRQEEPSGLPAGASVMQFRFLCKTGEQALIETCVAFLEKEFRRYYSFHRFHAPFLHYYYLAKRGCMSLYAPAWIRIGLLILVVACYAGLSGYVSPTPREANLLLLVILVCFWLPGIMMIFRFPYLKLWFSWVEQFGSVQLTVTVFSPFQGAGPRRLGRSIESAFGELQRLPLPQAPGMC